jgi:hypothetical protein
LQHDEQPLLTVVTPVRNGADHLWRLSETILREFGGSSAFAWVVVDDGSSDDTSSVLETLAGRLGDRLNVLATEGIGSGPARNLGLEAVTSTWVTFVDVDDDLEEGALSAWLDAAESTDADLLITRSPRGLSARRTRRWTGPTGVLSPTERWSTELLRDWIPGGKLYRTRFLQQAGICYASAAEGQDVTFFVRAAVHATRVAKAPMAPGYVYGLPTNTAADRAPKDSAGTINEFGDAVDIVRSAVDDPAIEIRLLSPLYAGAAAVLLRGVAFVDTPTGRAELAGALQHSSAGPGLELRTIRLMDRRDAALCLAAKAVTMGPEAVARPVGRLYRWSQRRRNTRTRRAR